MTLRKILEKTGWQIDRVSEIIPAKIFFQRNTFFEDVVLKLIVSESDLDIETEAYGVKDLNRLLTFVLQEVYGVIFNQ
jgi:menaquinone-dependent protoporphyrinogen IX oxidase